jgi:hypothetical protein
MSYRGLGQELPDNGIKLEIPPGVTLPALPGYVTATDCEAATAELQKRWDDHVPMMVVGGVVVAIAGFFAGKAMK